MSVNKYTKALNQIKDKTLDEKLKLLEELPTNHTSGLYVSTPGFVDPEIEVPGDIDSPLNLEEDGDGDEGYTGNDTTGLFMPDGTIKAIEPPGDTSYILGPMMSMWYAWANYTQIGYVRESDRKMVNLGRIVGEMSAWDGETGFTGYGQMSLEQAVWFKDQTRTDYRAFYPGPPSNPPDQYGRYIGSMISVSKPTSYTIPENPFKRYTPGTQRGFDPSDDHSLAMDNLGGWMAAAAVLGFVGKGAWEFFQWLNRQNEDMKQKLRDLMNRDYKSKEHKLQDVAGLRPDGTQGMNKLGDVVPDHFGRPMKLVPRPGYGYNMWVPVKKAVSDWNNALVAGHEPKGELLSEDRKRIFRDIKKPVHIKEMPTKFKVKPTGRKNKSVGVDMMKVPNTPTQYKPPMNIWGKEEYNQNVKRSQEKKNEVLELVGAAEHHWTYLVEYSKKKQQENVNEMLSAEYDEQMKVLYEKHKIKESKIDKTISVVKKNNDMAPEDAPPPPKPAAVGPDGYHTKYGKNYKHDKLDPHSAESMPLSGDPEIDANVKKATNTSQKSRKLKVLLGKGSNPISNNSTRGKKSFSSLKAKLGESMTTSSFMSTTLDAAGDALTNDTINTGDSNSFNPELSYIKLNSADTPLSNTASSSVFPGAFGGDDVMYFNLPFASTDGNSASSPDFFTATTKPFKCESDTLTLKAIAGNSTGQGVGQGLGTNGGTQPWKSVDVWWFSYDDNGQLEDAGSLGEIPNSLHTATDLEFPIPPELVGKNISINFYNNANNGGMTASSYLQGFSVPWHSRSLQKDSGSSDYSSQLAWTIINWNQLPSDNWYKENISSLQSMVFLLWSDMQGAYTNDSQWWDQDTATTQGYPAPVSGSRYPPGTMSGETDVGMTDADLNYLVNWFQSNMSQYNGMTTTTYGIGDLKFKRKAPINVFVSLDSPEATAFIRTDPSMQGLSAEDRRKKLIEMLDAGDEYLLKQLGIIGSSARPSDPTMPDSWEQAGGYGAGGPNPYGTPGAEPAYSHTKKMRINVDGTMKDINADDKSQWPSILKKADASSGDTEIAGGIPYGTPGADKPYVRKGYKDKKGKFVDYDNPSTWPSIIKKASNKQKSMVAHHEPKGETIMEKNKKSFKDITNKIPGYYDGKPAPLGFPIEEPPKTVNGKHPDLVDGKKVSDRYNRLDPISAKAMPKTGNPHIDKKVAKAQKKAK